MAEHRVPMLGAALRRASLRGRPDPEHSSDPQVRELVAALATLEIAPAPRADFRAELRAQLVAVTPRLVAEGDTSAVTADERAEQRRKSRAAAAIDRPQRRRSYARPLIAAACVLTAFVVLLGGAVWISKKALPGDSLYGLKRASEDTQYSLTGGAVAKARLKLDFAANRIDEVAQLLPRPSALGAGVGPVADGGISSETASLVRDTLSSADGDVTDAARMLTQAAQRNHSAAPLSVLTQWAPAQQTKMYDKVYERIPANATSLKARALHTWTLIRDAARQAQAAKATVTKPAPATTRVPGHSGTVTTHSSRAPVAPRSSLVPPAPGGGTKPVQGSTSARPTHGAPAPGASTAKSSSPPLGGLTTTPGLPLPSGLVPSLPVSTSTPKLPVTVDTCGLHASLGPIGINVGGC